MKSATWFAFVLGLCALAGGMTGCQTTPSDEKQQLPPGVYQTLGEVERLDPAFDALIPADAKMEVVAEGFVWSEGPLWVPDSKAVGGGYLLFSDIPPNRVMKLSYNANGGSSVSVYLDPSGYDGPIPRTGAIEPDEPGSNGLLLDPKGRLVLCQHGNRQVARMAAPLNDPMSKWITLAGRYNDERLNSPNDAAFGPGTALYFTDPPYGLTRKMEDHWKKIPFQGVYMLSKYGHVTLLTKELTRPNGIAFSPDYTKLYVANSDPDMPIWKWFPVNWDGTLGEGHVFADASERVGKYKGLPDGMKVDVNGNVFATGPGGVYVFNAQGDHLGTLLTGEATSNVAFGGRDGNILYITADSYILRIRTNTHGAVVGVPHLPEMPTGPTLDYNIKGSVTMKDCGGCGMCAKCISAGHCAACEAMRDGKKCPTCAEAAKHCPDCAKMKTGMCAKCAKMMCDSCDDAKKMCDKCAAEMHKCEMCAKSKTGMCAKCAEMCAKCPECAKKAAK
ncbi:MAG: hypothetical protein GC159_09835 [Phycisphaera sp.]|nr:hypothetical protein [Phycisphaera sp.]